MFSVGSQIGEFFPPMVSPNVVNTIKMRLSIAYWVCTSKVVELERGGSAIMRATLSSFLKFCSICMQIACVLPFRPLK